jgi:murein DD-endopeptidase MepM/ murein hydrolase activator NlpD
MFTGRIAVVEAVFYFQKMKRILLTVAILALLYTSCTRLLQNNSSVKEREKEKHGPDTSYIYHLPFESGKKVFLIQGYESAFSHKGYKALDFKVKMNTPVHAARSGVVTAARGDSDEGGLKQKNLADGNYIFVQHEDGSQAQYWHFKLNGVLVKAGDVITAGQLIGYSGNTGYSAFPHLHFEVSGTDIDGQYKSLPTRFYTTNGVEYLRPGRFYKTK